MNRQLKPKETNADSPIDPKAINSGYLTAWSRQPVVLLFMSWCQRDEASRSRRRYRSGRSL